MMLRRGFTLMEVVLAIALTSVVVYLLTTAIELYMVRVDSSRSRVESAQLARTILDRIAGDLVATRLHAPSMSGGGGGAGGGNGQGGGGSDQQGGASSGGQSGGQSGGLFGSGGNGVGSGQQGGDTSASGGGVVGGGLTSGTSAMTGPSVIQGIFGTIDTLRIDRAAYGDWQRAARPVDPLEPASAADQPVTVRYYWEQGKRQSAEELAAKGVSDERKRQSNVSGLYRQIIPTAALATQTDPFAVPADHVGPAPELMAPEVVKLELAYYDGEKAFQEWDTSTSLGLPSGVEIILTLYESRDDEAPAESLTRSDQTYRQDELVEYRRFVRLPYISPPQPAEALLPVPGSGNNQPGSGQPGQGGSNGSQGGGQQSSGNNGGQNGGQGGSNGR